MRTEASPHPPTPEVADATRELGGALGVAVLGSVAAWRYRAVATAGDGEASGSLGELVTGGQTGPEVVELARLAFVDGMSLAVLAAAAVALLAAAIVPLRAPDDRPARSADALPGRPLPTSVEV